MVIFNAKDDGEPMSPKIITVANMKGGVGKTTTSVTLAETLTVNNDFKVLLIDCDPQTNATLMLTGENAWEKARNEKRTLNDYFFWPFIYNKREPLTSFMVENASDLVISGTDRTPDLAVVPSHPDLPQTEREYIRRLVLQGQDLNGVRDHVVSMMQNGIEELGDRFDFVIIDCPPGISYFAEAAILLANIVITPVTLDYVAKYGLDRISQFLTSPVNNRDGRRRSYYALPTKFRNLEEQRARLDLIKNHHPVLPVKISDSVQIARAAYWSSTRRTFASKYGSENAEEIKLLGEAVLDKMTELV